MKTPEPKKRTVRKEFLFFPKEIEAIEEAAEVAGLNAGEWLRSVALAEAKKINAARKDVAVNWTKAARAKKLLESLKESHVHE
jgi:hypothetical protein